MITIENRMHIRYQAYPSSVVRKCNEFEMFLVDPSKSQFDRMHWKAYSEIALGIRDRSRCLDPRSMIDHDIMCMCMRMGRDTLADLAGLNLET